MSDVSDAPVTLRGALAYAGLGWRVLPILPGDKRPASRHGLHDATSDPSVIAAWWEQRPRLNVGLRTGPAPNGSGFDVVDIDCADEVPTPVLHELLEDPGPMTGTPRLGAHLLYAATGEGNRAGLWPGVDYRGTGGYIVAPPSVSHDGQRYVWATDWRHPLGKPGPLLASRLRPPAPARPVPQPLGVVGKGYGGAALASEVALVLQAPVGTRNTTLNTAALKLGQLVAGGVLGEGEVVAELLGAALVAGLPVSEAEATIASGLAAGAKSPRGTPRP